MNFDIRKQLLDFDNVMNKQREMVYTLRNQVLDGRDMTKRSSGMIEETIEEKPSNGCPQKRFRTTGILPLCTHGHSRIFLGHGGMKPKNG